VGIDWAEATQDGGLQAAGAAKREGVQRAHTPAALDAWGTTLRTRVHGQPVALGLALNQGPLGFALRQSDFLLLCPIQPLTWARYREACTPSRAKDDPSDADLQLARLRTQRDKLPPLPPHSPTRRALAQRVAHRRRVGGDTGRLTHRLTRTLKNSCPQVRQWLEDTETDSFCDFLRRWPTLTAAPLARRTPLETCCRDHLVRAEHVSAQRRHALKAATPLTTAEGVIAPHALLVPALVAPRRGTWQAMAAFDTAMAPRAQSPPDFPLFQALPGAGPLCAPRLRVACGAQRARDASAAERHKEAGIAPVTARSGTKAWGHWRLPCPKCRRQTFGAWAAASLRHACWAQRSDQQQRAKGKAQQAAVRALAFTWLRILDRCWQDRTPDEESVYLQALHQRGSSRMHNFAG